MANSDPQGVDEISKYLKTVGGIMRIIGKNVHPRIVLIVFSLFFSYAMAAKVQSSKSILKEWDKTGRSEFLRSCEVARESFDATTISRGDVRKCLYNFVKMTLNQALTLTDAINTLKEGAGSDPFLISLFTDVIAVVDIETALQDDKRKREQFLLFLSALHSVIPKAVLKARLDPETLEQAQLIPSQLLLNQKLVRTKTKLFYKQQKYNLLREESEGYAKLITELSRDDISR